MSSTTPIHCPLCPIPIPEHCPQVGCTQHPASDTDAIRKAMVETGMPLIDLAANAGPTWDTDQLRAEYEVLGFSAPFVVVRRRSDGVRGSLEFTHSPRVYFNWIADTPSDQR